MKEKKAKRKFIAIIKSDITGIPNNFKKYRTNNIDNFLKFMINKYPNCLYANFYYNTGINKGSIYKTWGKNKGLI